MRLISVVKKYGEKTVLSVPSLTIERGETVAVLGESGAGKSTLLRVVSGELPHEGRVEDAGKVSHLFQSPKLLPNLTAAKNLQFVLPKELWAEIPGMLARVGLSERGGSLPSRLSGGEKQRVAIARAILFPHDTLLMDEPFSSLDLSLKRAVMELTRTLCEERGETVLFVTHGVHEAAFFARRAIVLKEGRVTADLPIEGERDFFKPHPAEGTLIRALTD